MIPLLPGIALQMSGIHMGMHMGRVRLSAYGVCAAAGLVAALWLSQRTARRAGIDPDRLWDAGILAICAAFVVSRLLLIVQDPKAFLRYPLLLLALPSLTYGGMALTAVLSIGYLRWKRLPLRDVLDAWAPCGALLAALLSVGNWLTGADVGMPTRLPWGRVMPGDEPLGRVHPVQIYALLAALLLLGLLLRLLNRRHRGGSVAAVALAAGGVVSFLLDMVTAPVEGAFFGRAGSLLDAGQWIALAAILAGSWMWATAPPRLLARQS